MTETLPPPIDAEPALKPVMPASGKPTDFGDSPTSGGAVVAAEPLPLVAMLDFVEPHRREVAVSLEHPFIWEGQRVDGVKVRRLISAIYGQWDASAGDTDDLYGLMCGLPGPVIRGLDADDRRAIAEAAFPFLPRALRQAIESSAGADSGEAMSAS